MIVNDAALWYDLSTVQCRLKYTFLNLSIKTSWRMWYFFFTKIYFVVPNRELEWKFILTWPRRYWLITGRWGWSCWCWSWYRDCYRLLLTRRFWDEDKVASISHHWRLGWWSMPSLVLELENSTNFFFLRAPSPFFSGLTFYVMFSYFFYIMCLSQYLGC